MACTLHVNHFEVRLQRSLHKPGTRLHRPYFIVIVLASGTNHEAKINVPRQSRKDEQHAQTVQLPLQNYSRYLVVFDPPQGLLDLERDRARPKTLSCKGLGLGTLR